MGNKKKWLTLLLLLVCVPAVAVLGAVIFGEKYYAFMALFVAVLTCLPLFYTFERKNTTSAELSVLAVLVALSALGRLIFAFLPGFKPVTAIVVLAAVYFGKEAGFAVGAFSALVSNFYFGQGPWTPFQMCAWGLIGFAAGLLQGPLRRNRLWLCLYGAVAGVLYSAAMDVWTVLWAEGGWNWSRYLATAVTALPTTVLYAVSNIIFLFLLARPIGDKLERLHTKFGLFRA